jgi:hypothetical protein
VICDQMRYLTKNMKTYLEVVKEDKIHGTCRTGGKQLVIIKMSTNYYSNLNVIEQSKYNKLNYILLYL